MKIKIKLDVSSEGKTEIATLSDLGLTKKEWDTMDNESRKAWVQDYIDYMPEQPYWYITSFEEQ